MKLNRIILVGIFSGLAFTSCRDSSEAGRGFEVDESVDYERVEVEGEPEEETSVDVLIRRNDNLTTFAENLEKNKYQQNWGDTAGQGTMNGEKSVSGENISAGRESSNTTGERTSETKNTEQSSSSKGMDRNETQTSMQEGYTIFAPSNDAFDILPEDQRNAILNTNNREENLASINYLMVDQRLEEDRLKEQIENSNGAYIIKTMQGENITATLNGEIIILKDAKGNEASVVEINDQAQDGVLYIINGVLLPGDLSKNESSNRNME